MTFVFRSDRGDQIVASWSTKSDNGEIEGVNLTLEFRNIPSGRSVKEHLNRVNSAFEEKYSETKAYPLKLDGDVLEWYKQSWEIEQKRNS